MTTAATSEDRWRALPAARRADLTVDPVGRWSAMTPERKRELAGDRVDAVDWLIRRLPGLLDGGDTDQALVAEADARLATLRSTVARLASAEDNVHRLRREREVLFIELSVLGVPAKAIADTADVSPMVVAYSIGATIRKR